MLPLKSMLMLSKVTLIEILQPKFLPFLLLKFCSSDVWYHQREGRITASSVFNCLHFGGQNNIGHLGIKQILGQER